MSSRKLYLTFPQELLKEAVICDMYDRTRVKFNIRQASVSEEVGIVGLELSGDDSRLQQAIDYLRERGVRVEPIELDVME